MYLHGKGYLFPEVTATKFGVGEGNEPVYQAKVAEVNLCWRSLTKLNMFRFNNTRLACNYC